MKTLFRSGWKWLACLGWIGTGNVQAQTPNNPLTFIENKGQWPSSVKYAAPVGNGAIYFSANQFRVVQHDPEEAEALLAEKGGHVHGGHAVANQSTLARMKARGKGNELKMHAYDVEFVGAASSPVIIAEKAEPGHVNFLIGDDPSKWGQLCKTYQVLTVKNVYPNIDVRYYTNEGQLKYDIIARPGADIKRIALRYKNAGKLAAGRKELKIETSVGRQREFIPLAYQISENGRSNSEVNYLLIDSTLRFQVKNYNPNQTLVIDPTWDFSTFSGSRTDNWGFTATYGAGGTFFGGGIAWGTGFPINTGPGFAGGQFDIGIMKLTADGADRIFATYIGGSEDDQPHSLIADSRDQLILAGRTTSSNYPGTNRLGARGGWDIVITKLSANGSTIIGSTVIGSSGDDGVNIVHRPNQPTSLARNYGDGARSEVIIDNGDNVWVASCTNNPNFPQIGSTYQNGHRGLQDGLILKLNNNCNQVLISSFFGGAADDACYVVTQSVTTGNIYIGGGTASSDLPDGSGRTVSNSLIGNIDGFIAELNPVGSTIIRRSYIGTSGIDQVYGIQTDRRGFPYVMGTTTGNMTPINAPYNVPNGKQFIGKLEPDLSNYIYLTTWGSAGASVPNISPTAFLVDRCENVYVSGWGGNIQTGQGTGFNSTTSGLPVTPDAFQRNTDGSDFYFIVIEKNARSLLYAQFFGQNGGQFPDHVDGGTSRFDSEGVIYQTICANCGGGAVFPTTSGVWSSQNQALSNTSGGRCNMGMVKISMNLAGIGSEVRSEINGIPNKQNGCIPLTVNFRDTLAQGQRYLWNFGDGSPSVTTNTPDVSHTYTAVGIYRVLLTSIDSNSCNIIDTSTITIRAGDNEIRLDLDFVKLDPCEANAFRFTNNSFSPNGIPITNVPFLLRFGDGSAPITIRAGDSVDHRYPGAGTYNASLTLIDSSFCNAPDSIVIPLVVATLVDADIVAQDTVCRGSVVNFRNANSSPVTYNWSFGDGGTASTATPAYTYQNVGTFTVQLIAANPLSCNGVDTATKTIVVVDAPVASFTVAPVPPIENTPNRFTNTSTSDAVQFFWDFGDGDSSRLENPVHQYNTTGTFTACLIVLNNTGCPDTVCTPVQTIVNPVFDIPSAFTPNGDGINDQVRLRGFGIERMQWRIYNRFGNLVFESNNPADAWDGRWRNQNQPADVYVYTCEVQFVDGRQVKKTGDITLIR